MTQEEAWATLDVVASALLLYHLPVYMLFDPRATHFFVVSKKVGKLGKSSCRVEKGFTISTLLRENIDIYMVYMSMKLDVMGVWDEYRFNTLGDTWFWYYMGNGLVG